MHVLTHAHIAAAYKVLRYLKNFLGKGLLYQKHGNHRVVAYTDADGAGSIADRWSTLGYCTFVGGNLVTWQSKKQSIVARSSAETEFRFMTHGICELLWLRMLITKLGLHVPKSTSLYYDNKAAISMASDPLQHDKTKHIEVDHHFIKDHLKVGCICMPFIQTKDQLADIFTKGLIGTLFSILVDKLGMLNIYSPAWYMYKGYTIPYSIDLFQIVYMSIQVVEDIIVSYMYKSYTIPYSVDLLKISYINKIIHMVVALPIRFVSYEPPFFFSLFSPYYKH